MNRAPMLLAVALLPVLAQRTGPSRDDILHLARTLNDRLLRAHVESPYNILSYPQGFYLDGFGAIFAVELSLTTTPGVSPFRPAFTAEEKERIRAAKLQRLPALKLFLRDFLVTSAANLDRLPDSEQLVVGVTLFYHDWESRNGLPQQLIMQSAKRPLVEVAANRADRSTLDKLVKVREF